MPKKRKPSKPSPKPAAKPKPHRATGKPPGRPEGQGYHPTDEQRNLVKTMAGYRIPQDEMVTLVINPQTKEPISERTLVKHFPNELKQGYATLRLRIMAATVRNALGVTKQGPGGEVIVEQQGNVTAQIWLQKTLYGARELVDVIPPKVEDSDDDVIDGARTVAFVMALGARAAQAKKGSPKP